MNKNKAIFLDRDGVINIDRDDHVKSPEEFILNPGIGKVLKKYKEDGFLLIVISNQSGIAKGLFSHHHLKTIHQKMKDLLSAEGVTLDEIYYCPHFPIVSNCLCRKPGSLMIEKAIARFDIDPAKSLFIGDAARDIQAGEAAGVPGLRVERNHVFENAKH